MKRILIKISGEIFSYPRKENNTSPSLPTINILNNIANQIKTISAKNKIGIVIGGGNFFRGNYGKDQLNISTTCADNIGMLSTIVNGLIFKEILKQNNVSCSLLSALQCPSLVQNITQNLIENELEQKKCIIFVGGTGNPFFTTDTNAILRALQINADEVWKATKVDGVYNADPLKVKTAKRYQTIGYQDVLDKKLKIMDTTAIMLAKKYSVTIRVFNLFEPEAFYKILENPDFGSTIR